MSWHVTLFIIGVCGCVSSNLALIRPIGAIFLNNHGFAECICWAAPKSPFDPFSGTTVVGRHYEGARMNVLCITVDG